MVWNFANGDILEYIYHGNGIVIPNEDLPFGLVLSHDSESQSFENDCDTSVEQCDIISVNITVAN